MSLSNKKISTLSLTMLNISAIISLSSIAYMATIGLQSIFFYLIAAITFLLPTSLICAELSSMITQNNGGMFSWVKAGLGEKAGVLAMWLEWFNNVVGFPSSVTALIATFSYIGFRGFAENTHTSVSFWLLMVVVFIAISLFNCLPMRKVVILNIVGAVFGMIIPGILLILGAIYFLVSGQSNLEYHGVGDILPAFSLGTYALLVKTLSSYSGIQSVAFHMTNIEKPERNIPKSILIATVIIVSLTILATIGLDIIIPVKDVNVLNGLIQGISQVLNIIGLGGVKPLIVVMISIGMLAALSTWVLGPARGMQTAAEQHLFPKIMAGKNRFNMPVNMLMIQICIVIVLSTAFLIMPSVYAAFALLVAITSQFTVVAWIMVFVAAIRLRFTKPDTHRVFYVGKRGSNWLLVTISVVAIFMCALGFILGFFPPGFSHVTDILRYTSILIVVDIIIIAIPLIWIWLHRKKIM
ncbi:MULTISPECIES: APC family permease [unclassified Francisella]|uniref:APC family permease n=1 Tax=unclassified Francisella TaxID=2610885 RepID=UPI002E358572|nr:MULTISPECIES: APC family permease [unclassified Francisella]MED7819672.1 APC family permease [Francisella sp. 19S2-4]MED7830506.1 APC family permease [Francisella sp. 19S2-10]